ncbi:hypothetical protein [Xanthomonas arboricola]|uniref:hypothetical protein n=1 Tax=Xanthomonas arboricola TaxID=56448 RepID=UPI000C84B239|nr:hypothetical protein [Xanthomonas arboricola]PPT19408.1 hypothetical protein XarCFBP6771_14720 [Xanthomonas arboricola]SOU09264.1 hypothetical protein LMG19145_00347 [Xanthomonas arboricola pv. fragariae]
MGLSISVGGMEDQEMYAPVARALTEAGLPGHAEPPSSEDEPFFSCQMWGYSGLHYLRRLAAYIGQGLEVPGPADDDPAADPVLAEYYDLLAPGFEHLVLHSDAEGFYAPHDFESVIFPSEEVDLPGGMLGSSPRLLEECRRLAAWLELPPEIDPESEEVWGAADLQQQPGLKWKQYGIESFTCLRLIGAAEASVFSGAAIVFC